MTIGNYKERPGTLSTSMDEQLPESIRALDLGPIKFKLLTDESPVNWTPEQVDWVEEEYRRFLALAILHPHKKIVPSGAIDAFWHMHILDTGKYAEDCDAIFGRFVHHFPYLGLRGESDAAELEEQWNQTLAIYRDTFGEPPAGTWSVMADCGRTGCGPGPGDGSKCTNK